MRKKGISDSKNFACSMHSVTQLWLIWKSLIKPKSLTTKQWLSPRKIISQNHIPGISLLNKNIKKLFHPPGVDCPSFPWTFMGNHGDGGKSYPTRKNVLIFPIRKIPLKRLNLLLLKVSFLPHQKVICSCSHFCCIIF